MPTVVMFVHVFPGEQGCQIIRGNYGLTKTRRSETRFRQCVLRLVPTVRARLRHPVQPVTIPIGAVALGQADDEHGA
jgi:hypothetical protein